MVSTKILFEEFSGGDVWGGRSPVWLSRAVYANGCASARKKILIVIFQRGAVDGLNVVIPHGDTPITSYVRASLCRVPDGTEYRRSI